MITSVYIHIPFCKKICSYCDFCKMLYLPKLADNYFDALEKEIQDRYMKDSISTLYIGGGTPSALSDKDLDKLASIVRQIELSDEYEFTFECNIYDIKQPLLEKLKLMRVNRLSIGIESFDKNNLALMNRTCSFKDVQDKILLCRKNGFDNINLDLMYALPNESFKTLKKDLKLVLKLKPEHISTYSLILENNTMLKIKGYKSIDEETDLKMYRYIVKKLKKSGFEHYEISNFAKKGFSSCHNLNCWNNLEYYGFGLGASGYFAGVRYQNTKSLNEYLKLNTVLEKEIVTKDLKMKYELILGLRKIKGINLDLFYQKYKQDFESVFNIALLLKNKDLIKKNNYLFVNPKKIYLMNEILLKII